jgi:hypothetical protein
VLTEEEVAPAEIIRSLLGLEYTAASVFPQILFLLRHSLRFVSAVDISKWKILAHFPKLLLISLALCRPFEELLISLCTVSMLH